VLAEANEVVTWGRNVNANLLKDIKTSASEISKYENVGHLGQQGPNTIAKPQAVGGITGTIIDVACGGGHTVVATCNEH